MKPGIVAGKGMQKYVIIFTANCKGGGFFMITKKRTTFRCVHGTDAADFEQQMNEILREALDPEITYVVSVPFLAYVRITESKPAPECLADVYGLQGKSFRCGDCPYLKRSKDMRRRYHGCLFHENVARSTDSSACEEFYIMLGNGTITMDKILGKGVKNVDD